MTRTLRKIGLLLILAGSVPLLLRGAEVVCDVWRYPHVDMTKIGAFDLKPMEL